MDSAIIIVGLLTLIGYGSYYTPAIKDDKELMDLYIELIRRRSK